MPVQINEVVIKAVVNQPPAAAGAAAGSPPPAQAHDAQDSDLAEKILTIIREKKER
ncbi:MAG: DUF5908 family protein [Chitinophagaceae bacterium]|jgi:ribosomal protein L12E/L44/L45/RPP1/RPP2|nr:DUF5908 family protein [Chitinophagaceae bacterium]